MSGKDRKYAAAYKKAEYGGKQVEALIKLRDYSAYEMSIKEKAICILIASAAIYAVAYVFYRSHALAALFLPLSFAYPAIRKKQLCERTKKELNIQFKDMLYSLSSSVSAGKTLEAAFGDAIKDLAVIYPNHDAPIISEVEIILRKLKLNETLENAVMDFAARSHLEDIENFAEVIRINKRSGGNMAEAIKNASAVISDKIEICQEIEVMLSEKKFEQKVLNVTPVIMVILLSLTSYDYMEPVFTTLTGRVVMTVAVGLMATACFISRKISNISV
jgi:tight adherence protein B